MKQPAVGALSLLVLLLTWSSAAADPITFSFSGQITERRVQNSIFTGGIGDPFSGYFSYDPAAPSLYPPGPFGFYPLVAFSIDGKSLNFSNGTAIPFIPGVFVQDGLLPFPGFPDSIEIRGFYLPAAAGDPNDNGSVSVTLTDFTGAIFANGELPITLDLGSFTDARVTGPVFVSSPAPEASDRGAVTRLALVPEPSVMALSGLGLLLIQCYRRRHSTVIISSFICNSR